MNGLFFVGVIICIRESRNVGEEEMRLLKQVIKLSKGFVYGVGVAVIAETGLVDSVGLKRLFATEVSIGRISEEVLFWRRVKLGKKDEVLLGEVKHSVFLMFIGGNEGFQRRDVVFMLV